METGVLPGPADEGLAAAEAELRAFALTFPDAVEDYPWGQPTAKVRGKAFVFFGRPGDGSLSFSVKLPRTAPEALSLPFCAPTGYGLGKAGWVTVRLAPGEPVLMGWLQAWIGESYRAVAPKRLVKALDGG